MVFYCVGSEVIKVVLVRVGICLLELVMEVVIYVLLVNVGDVVGDFNCCNGWVVFIEDCGV